MKFSKDAWEGFDKYPPSIIETIESNPIKEATMAMEKRAVVDTPKEKTAHDTIEKKKAGTTSGRTPSGKPNQANAPKGNKDG